jgi:hypothetical protein
VGDDIVQLAGETCTLVGGRGALSRRLLASERGEEQVLAPHDPPCDPGADEQHGGERGVAGVSDEDQAQRERVGEPSYRPRRLGVRSDRVGGDEQRHHR